MLKEWTSLFLAAGQTKLEEHRLKKLSREEYKTMKASYLIE